MTLQEKLAKGVVLVAEGYVFELARRGLVSRGAFVPEVVLDHPEAVLELHREFVRAGSDVVLALTYYAHEEKMKVRGRADDCKRINTEAIWLARRVAHEFPGTLVAGNICNTSVFNPARSRSSGKEVRRMFTDQVSWAAGSVDFVVAETFSYLEEALIAHEVISDHGLPSVVTFAVEQKVVDGKVICKTCDGYPIVDACRRLADEGALVVGLNCMQGPVTMRPLMRTVRAAVGGHVATLPVAYRTFSHHQSFFDLPRLGNAREKAFPEHLDSHLHDLGDVVSFASDAVALGVNYVGLCCGASPEMIRAIALSLGRTPPSARYATNMDQHYIFGKGKHVRTFNRRRV